MSFIVQNKKGKNEYNTTENPWRKRNGKFAKILSFPLSRLPLLAISEVIKSMRTREIFYLSVLSKKSANFVMLSIPKNSLSAELTFRNDHFEFELMPEGFMKHGAKFLPAAGCETENETVITRFSTCDLYIQSTWASTFEFETYTRKLFYRFSKIFKNSKLCITFKENIREEFAMEIMRFALANNFLFDRIQFCLTNASSESIQELLNRCNGHHTSLCIRTKIPKDFKCTPPPGGYKFKSFEVHDAHWVNLDDFSQGREVFFWQGIPGLTVEYLNGLLKRIVNLECRFETFNLSLRNRPSDFAAIVEGLSESEIEQEGLHQKLQFERKDGLKLMITFSYGYNLRMTTF
ncbi:hypothetical protein CAEBREN_20922 [Caenorhabditis brenneri]|uniref:F-box domain-containing protein n=1 Tax=Caenorhabditis brenneri TaxID=135651 RepID=G0NXJ4_CAEBE|nr:hypothetical protein CAEBREN_20922 [Caenorhabditis brenneri]